MYRPPNKLYDDEEFVRETAPIMAELATLHPWARYMTDHPQHARYVELARTYRRIYQRVWQRLYKKREVSSNVS